MKPTNRKAFKEYCLRALGAGAIQINVTDDQVEDRIDEALDFWQQHHFEATERIFYRHTITDVDKQNKYIVLPEDIIGVTRILNKGFTSSYYYLFNPQYHIAFSLIFDQIPSQTMVPYWMMVRRFAELEEWLAAQPMFEWTRHGNKLIINTDWDKYAVGDYMIIEGRRLIDSEDIWKDHWLQRYTTNLIKRQWGSNLKKYTVTLPSGIVMNGKEIYDEADTEIKAMEAEVLENLQTPLGFFVG